MAHERLKNKTLKVGGFLEELEKDGIKDRIDIVSLFAEFGVALSKKRKAYTGLCPWHTDKDPSLSVDKDKGLYNCFGCGESGDIFTLVEKMKGVGFKGALEFLQSRTGSEAAAEAPRRSSGQGYSEIPETRALPQNVKKSTTQKMAASRGSTKTYTTIAHDITLSAIAEFYHKKLYESKQAREYLEKRGIKDPKLWERFKLGYADGSLLKVTANGQREALKVLGLVRENGNEHLYSCITFPVFDEQERPVSFYGRNIEGSGHLYLPGPHQSVWNRKASTVYDEIILTESIIDALSLVAMGIENVQACYGTNGFTKEHLQILKDDRVKTVIIGFDNDTAGKNASDSLMKKLLSSGFNVKVIFPPSKDWNEHLIAGGKAEQVKQLIKEAQTYIPKQQKESFTVSKEGAVYKFDINEITYQLAGVKELFVQDLRVNIKAVMDDESFYDKLDLYSSRSRSSYSASLSTLFEVEQKRIERDLITMLEHLEKERDKALLGEPDQTELSAEEIKLGMEFLASENMFEQIVKDMDTLGYVGEELNKKLVYLAASTRILDDPISVLILSQSASGKSMLVDTVKKLLPGEDVLSLTSLSDQALNYIPSLMHKFLVLGEAVHNEVIEHQIREMLSGKELSRLVTLKDPKTGELKSRMVKTPAIVSCVMSTTRQNINPENASRFFVVNTDESSDQTRRIHQVQRKKYTLNRYEQKSNTIPQVITKHHAAQRLLEKVVVVNEFALSLDFPDMLMRTRRDHDRFMDLIAGVCFLRQFQKEKQQKKNLTYISCDLTDYSIAYEIMVKGVLASTMVELPKSAVTLYEELRTLARKLSKKNNIKVNEMSFSQREVREQTGFGHSWIRENLRKLVDFEYIARVSGRSRGERGVYRLKADEDITSINFSMIPTPDEISNLLTKK